MEKRTRYLIIVLFLVGIVGGLILLAAVSPKYLPYKARPMDYNADWSIENIWPILSFLSSILGVLVFLFFKLGAKVPDWRNN